MLCDECRRFFFFTDGYVPLRDCLGGLFTAARCLLVGDNDSPLRETDEKDELGVDPIRAIRC